MKNILKPTKIKTKLIALLLSLIAFAGLTISIIFIRQFLSYNKTEYCLRFTDHCG